VFVGDQFDPVGLAILGTQEVTDCLVAWENCCGSTKFGPHVRDDVAVHRGQTGQPRPVVLDDPVHPALDIVAPQHFQDHVLGRTPFRQFAFQPHAPHLGHADVQRSPGYRECNLQPADADRQHAQRTRGRGV